MGYVSSMCRDMGESGFYNACNVHNKPALRFYERMGGVLTHTDDGHENPSQDQCYFEHKLQIYTMQIAVILHSFYSDYDKMKVDCHA